MRNYFPFLAGNESLCQRIGAEIQSEGFSNAFILEGPRGSGKHTLARAMTAAAACAHRADENYPLPCGECPSCRKIREGFCPDLISVGREPGKATMGVDTVRSIREGLSLFPNDLDFKAYLIEDAHTMTIQAQNAFLLTLEEPPSFVLFFLLTEDAGALLETVRSRAPLFRMQPVSDADMTAYLTEWAPAVVSSAARELRDRRPEEFAALLRLSGGSIGTAQELLDEKLRRPLLARRTWVLRVLDCLRVRTESESLQKEFSADGTRAEQLSRLSLLKTALRDLIVLSGSERAPLLFFTDREQAGELSAAFSLRCLFDFFESVEEAENNLLANANQRLTMTRLLTQLSTR